MKKINIFIPLILGSIVGLLLMNSFSFYQTLNKPLLSPPSWLFPIVWSILYLLMGISYYRVCNQDDNIVLKKIYYIQLFFNLMWPIIFFWFEQLLVSSIWIVCLDILIVIMICLFSKIDRKTRYLQLPYLVWTLFATYLNISVFILNF